MLLLALTQNQKYGEPSSGIGTVMLAISHNELAQMAAMSRPHVTVTTNKLRQRGFVDYGRNRSLMVNVPAQKTSDRRISSLYKCLGLKQLQ